MVGQLCWGGQEEILVASLQESEEHPQTQRYLEENPELVVCFSLVPPMTQHNLFLLPPCFPFTFLRAQKISIFLLFVLIWYTLVIQNTEFGDVEIPFFPNYFQGWLGLCTTLE